MKTKFLGFLFFAALQVSFQASASAPVLLFNGTGASASDVTALQSILTSMSVGFDTATSNQINSMTEAIMRSYKVIIWPGGNSIYMGNSLTRAATALVHKVVVTDGVSYLGFCAGAFMGERSTLYNVFNLASTWFNFYQQSAEEMVSIYFSDGTQRSLVYWDGPELSGFGSVIGKYPSGAPAIAEARVGYGFVLLSGVHPEAPADWRTGFSIADTDGVASDIAYTKTLIGAALTKTMLPHY